MTNLIQLPRNVYLPRELKIKGLKKLIINNVVRPLPYSPSRYTPPVTTLILYADTNYYFVCSGLERFIEDQLNWKSSYSPYRVLSLTTKGLREELNFLTKEKELGYPSIVHAFNSVNSKAFPELKNLC